MSGKIFWSLRVWNLVKAAPEVTKWMLELNTSAMKDNHSTAEGFFYTLINSTPNFNIKIHRSLSELLTYSLFQRKCVVYSGTGDVL